jgi:hypothetical protein
MANLIIRTEDIKPEHILELYVETSQEKRIVDELRGANPVVLESSRGTGKSFLLRVAEAELERDYSNDLVLPVYLSFTKSSLIQTKDPDQFLHWMMSRLCSRILRVLYQHGCLVQHIPAINLLSGGTFNGDLEQTPIERIADAFEESYKNPDTNIDVGSIPSVDDFKDAIEDICRANKLVRLVVLFDEAAHVMQPEQQRQFFTLFRDLRSPFLSCNAAVYPGVTFYGQAFEAAHDANVISLSRDVLDPDYLSGMRDIVFRQADSTLHNDIIERGENFNALALAVSGNPRLLLKTVALAGRLRTNDVEKVLKEFYRTDIWAEHSGLAEKYKGHRTIVDWGREFIEKTVIPDAISKNEQRALAGKSESTAFFWIHRDAPAAVTEALRLLCYTGIVTRIDSGIIATRKETGTRYAVNLGCLAAPSSKPITTLTEYGRTLSLKRFSEYGSNHPAYATLQDVNFTETDISIELARQLDKSIDVIDLTSFQLVALKSVGIDTVRKALQSPEKDFQKANYIGPVRSRKMKNVAAASVLEYLSG